MPASIVFVHDDSEFREDASIAFRNAGYRLAMFNDPIAALEATAGTDKVDVLVTRVRFPEGRPNGVSLSLVMRRRHPKLKVVFAEQASEARHIAELGELVPHPVDIWRLVNAIDRAVGR